MISKLNYVILSIKQINSGIPIIMFRAIFSFYFRSIRTRNIINHQEIN